MTDEAILAPVPADLLQDALDNGYTRVAFGSLAWEFFRRLSRLEEPIPLARLPLPNGKRLSSAFIPRGPIRVEAP